MSLKKIKELILRVLKKKYILLVAIFVLLSGIAGAAYNIFVLNRQQNMVIEFNYPGAEKGLNPDGSIFEISELKSPAVIEKAKENLNDKSVDTEFLRSRIFITSKVADNSVDKIIADVQEEKNTIYMPTTFHIYYSQKDKFSKNESKLFMESLAKAYSEYFTEKYSEKNDILMFKASDYDFENTDFIESHRIIKNLVDSMIDFVSAHQAENRAFSSDEKENLGMALEKLESFRDTSLEKFYAYVVQNGVSKNNAEFLKSLEYLIDDNDLYYKKKIEGSDIVKEAVDKYDPRIVAVAFVPSIDAKRNYYMSRTKTGIDDLTKMSYNDGMTAAKTLKDIEYYRSLVEKFSAVKSTSQDKKDTAESMLIELTTTLEALSEEILRIDDEYITSKTMNYFIIRPPEGYGISITLIAKFVILGGAVALALVIFNEFWKERLFKRVKVIDEAFAAVDSAKQKLHRKRRK